MANYCENRLCHPILAFLLWFAPLIFYKFVAAPLAERRDITLATSEKFPIHLFSKVRFSVLETILPPDACHGQRKKSLLLSVHRILQLLRLGLKSNNSVSMLCTHIAALKGGALDAYLASCGFMTSLSHTRIPRSILSLWKRKP